jgi:CBS domain-containing protein/RimJ/RimL family protein N-acetyltransferase
MPVDLSDTTIHNFPHAFINKKAEAILIRTLDESHHRELTGMYLAYEPRSSFSGLPPITDEACVRWVDKMIENAVNLIALSFEEGIVGHAALFPIDKLDCEILVAVSPSEQRIGIGTELTRCLIQLAHELGLERIRLSVEARNHVARHVYEKCGFRYDSRSLVDELDMSLDLESYRSSLDVPVREIMNRSVVCIRQDMSCREALKLFVEDGIATLPVVDRKNRLRGILSESDLLIEANIAKKVSEVLTREVVSVQEGYPVANVIPLFQSRKLRCIPVLDRHMKLVGVVGRRDILAHYLKRP